MMPTMPDWGNLGTYLPPLEAFAPFLMGIGGAAVAWVLFCLFRWAVVDPRVALAAALDRIVELEQQIRETGHE